MKAAKGLKKEGWKINHPYLPEFVHKFGESWNVLIFYSPEIFIVNAEIFMNNTVAESNNPSPFYFWMFGFKITRNSVGCLTDNLKISNNSIHRFIIPDKIIIRHSFCIAHGLFYSIINVFQ